MKGLGLFLEESTEGIAMSVTSFYFYRLMVSYYQTFADQESLQVLLSRVFV